MPDFDHYLDPSNPLQFFVFFIALWIAMLYLLSIIGGWAKLAEVYRADDKFAGPKWRFQSASMRLGTGYGNCLAVAVNNSGLSLSVLFIFRFGHPSLFIPWSDIRKQSASGWLRGNQLVFAKVPSVPFRIKDALLEKIQDARGQPIEHVT